MQNPNAFALKMVGHQEKSRMCRKVLHPFVDGGGIHSRDDGSGEAVYIGLSAALDMVGETEDEIPWDWILYGFGGAVLRALRDLHPTGLPFQVVFRRVTVFSMLLRAIN